MGFPAHSHIRLLNPVEKKGKVSDTLLAISDANAFHHLRIYDPGFFFSMARSWLVDSRALAKKVINAGVPAAYHVKDCGANTQCPNCHFLIDNSNAHEWPGLPAGVKFDPSDVELLDHLAAKQGVGESKPHLFIDEFIPTLEGEGGICCTHPENLPGARKDGSSVHFFSRVSNAYTSGNRKRRRVHKRENAMETHVRWHKTGKTKPIMKNGIQKGFKKIMVLYGTSKSGSKPERCNWVMHQFHLGRDEEEKEGEYVVSKIIHQTQKENENHSLVMEESDIKAAVQVIPTTPKITTPDLPRHDKTPYSDCNSTDHFPESLLQEQSEHLKEKYHASYDSRLEDDEFSVYLDTNTEAVDLSRPDSLLCNEMTEAVFGNTRPNYPSSTQANGNMSGVHERESNASCGIAELDNLELDTPPDFLAELQFASQDSVFDLLEQNHLW